MKRLFLSISIIFLFAFALCGQEKTVVIKILQTSDVHGAIFPYNFIEDKPMNTSLLQAYTYVKQQRSLLGNNLILLDNGDNLQGQPTVYYYNFIDTVSSHLLAQVMNFMGYNATSVGNHDIEAGHAVYDRIRRQYNFPMLSANIVNTRTGNPYFEPYTVFERDGVKIAVLGLITPHVPYWLPENLWSGMQFTDMLEAARKWVAIINEKERPDILIGLFHAGYKAGDNVDEPMNENASLLVAQQVAGFDAVFVGHDHDRLCKQFVNVNNDSVWVLDPTSNARYVSDVTFTLTVDNGKVKSKQVGGRLVDVAQLDMDDETRQFDAQFDTVKAFVSKPIGVFTKTISTRDAYFGPSAFVDLIHRIQLDVANADISFAAPLSFDTEIAKGAVYVRDMFKLYKYENMLYAMELTGQEVKDFLEFSYGLWIKQMRKPGDNLLLMHKADAASLRNGRFVNPSYNFDSAAGIYYEVDVTQPMGHRINIIKMANGEPFSLTKKYRVAINSYRGNGGGDHLTAGAGIRKSELANRIVFATDVDLRYYLMKWIEEQKTVNPKPLNQWKFIPTKWVKSAAKRDYQALFGTTKK